MSYYIIFFLSSFFALIGSFKGGKFIIYILIVILVLFAGTRLNIDNDYHMYFKTFYYIEKSINEFNERIIPLEWSVFFLPHFFGQFFTDKASIVKGVLLTYALLGVSTKIIAIEKYSKFFLLSILLYISNLFLMMEMTTIRAGVAAGVFLLAIDDLERKDNKNFIIKLLICFFFHSSSVLFVIPWLLLKVKLNIKFYYIAIIFSFVMAVAKINVLKLFFLDRLFPRIEIYFKMMEWQKNEGTNMFNFRILFALFMVFVFMFFYKKLRDIKYFDVLFKIHIFSICIFLLLSSTAEAFSLRSFELLSVVQILLYPMIIHIFTPKLKFIGWTVIILFSLIQLYYLVEIADIFKPYKSWFFN